MSKRNNNSISLAIIGVSVPIAFMLGLVFMWLVKKYDSTSVQATQPTIVNVLDLPEEFNLAGSDTLMCYRGNDTLYIRFSHKY